MPMIYEVSATDGEETSYRYFAMKGDASRFKREAKKANKELEIEGPTKIKVSNRDDLIELIAKIQGGEAPADDENDATSEFL